MSGYVEILGKISSHELCHLRLHERPGGNNHESLAVGIFVLHGSWNTGFDPEKTMGSISELYKQSIPGINSVIGWSLVDETEDSLTECLGDNEAIHSMGPVPPPELPAILVVAQDRKMDHSISEFVRYSSVEAFATDEQR